jgi:hypothetical protein
MWLLYNSVLRWRVWLRERKLHNVQQAEAEQRRLQQLQVWRHALFPLSLFYICLHAELHMQQHIWLSLSALRPLIDGSSVSLLHC